MALCRLLHSEVVFTVKPLFTDAHLIWTPHYYGQFALSLGNESPCIFSKFNPLNTNTPLIRTLFMTPSVTALKGLDRTTSECKTCLVDMISVYVSGIECNTSGGSYSSDENCRYSHQNAPKRGCHGESLGFPGCLTWQYTLKVHLPWNTTKSLHTK